MSRRNPTEERILASGAMSDFIDPRLEAIFQRRQTVDAGRPIEDAWERKTWRRILSGYNFDLGIAAVIYGLAIGVAIWAIVASHIGDTPQGLATGLQTIFGAAVFGTFIELLRRTYDAALKRLATIDLFTSEILSIMRVFASANIIGDFVRLYDRTGMPISPASDPVAASGAAAGVGFADSARKEDYFTIFNNSASDLASLDPAVANDITAFYTFLKASRDATGAIQLWKSPQYELSDKRDDIVAIVFLCFLMSVHGQLALEKLITSETNRWIANDIFAGVMLQCFRFLIYVVPEEDFRWRRIEQRRKRCEGFGLMFGYEFSNKTTTECAET
jgi:hypothetical protein